MEDEQQWLKELDRSIEQGLEDARSGRVRDLDEVWAEIDAELAILSRPGS